MLEGAAAAVILWAGLVALVSLIRARGRPTDRLRARFGSTLLLGLDFFVASDVLDLAFVPTLEAVAITATVVLVRVILTFTLEKELKEERQRQSS